MVKYPVYSAHHCNPCLTQAADKEAIECNKDTKLGDQQSLSSSSTLTIPQCLHTCSSCHLVVYCVGLKHQKIDWSTHKSFCRAVNKILTIYEMQHPFHLNGVPKTRLDIEKVGIKLRCLISAILERQLDTYETELSTFPSFCSRCLSFKRPLRVCANCHGVSYCSEYHAQEDLTEHKEICKFLKIYYCQYKWLEFPEVSVSINRRIDDLSNSDLKNAIAFASGVSLGDDPTKSSKEFCNFNLVADFSCILTICYVLEVLHLAQPLPKDKQMCIFIIGATVEAELWFKEMHTRLFFLQNPSINRLVLHFIGPEVKAESHSTNFQQVNGQSYSVEHIFYKGYYEDFAKDTQRRPDLFIAFNCGFSESTYDPEDGRKCFAWRPAVRAMLTHKNVPIAFTSFTEKEAAIDFEEVTFVASEIPSVSLVRILEVARNPFSDLRPHRNWQVSDRNDEIFYRNGYIQLIYSKEVQS